MKLHYSLGIALVVVALDVASKYWVESTMVYGQTIPITGVFNLVLTYNTGAAFSILSEASGWQHWLLSMIAVGASVMIIFLLNKYKTEHLFCLSLSLILGGAIGNVIDQAAVRPTICLAKVMANGGFQDVASGSPQALGSLCRAAGRLSFEITVDRILRRRNNLKGYKRTLFNAAKNARRYSKKGAKIEKFFEKINREPACRGVLH